MASKIELAEAPKGPKVGDEVAYVLKSQTVLPATITGFGTDSPEGVRIHLKSEEFIMEEYEEMDDDSGIARIKRRWVRQPFTRLNVRFHDPGIMRRKNRETGLDEIVRGTEGQTFKALPQFGRFTPGTWFDPAPFQYRIHLIRPAEETVNRLTMQRTPHNDRAADEKHLGPFASLRETWELWSKETQRGAGTYWNELMSSIEWEWRQ